MVYGKENIIFNGKISIVYLEQHPSNNFHNTVDGRTDGQFEFATKNDIMKDRKRQKQIKELTN